MFHSAAVKLTFWYLIIIMFLSAGTSFALYHVSSNELEQNAQRQVGYFRGLLGTESANEFARLRQRQLEEDRSHLRTNLFLLNLFVLTAGGIVSYALARRTLKPIEDALEAQTRFSSDASHELRTPLTAIQTENEVALRNSTLSKSSAISVLKSNLEEVGRLKALTEGLLSLAHAREDDSPKAAVSATRIISQAVERISKIARHNKIKIKQLKPKKDVLLKGDEQKLTDLMVILLDNAVKYSPANSEVKIKIKNTSKKAMISVEDEGQGISASDLPHIFERFYRTESSRGRERAGGYGLGLAIAKMIAEQHGSVIEVRSASGKGSTFTVHLPLA